MGRICKTKGCGNPILPEDGNKKHCFACRQMIRNRWIKAAKYTGGVIIAIPIVILAGKYAPDVLKGIFSSSKD